MRRNKLFPFLVLLLSWVCCLSAYAKTDSIDTDKDGVVDTILYWNDDGSLSKIERISQINQKTITEFENVSKATVNGQKLSKYTVKHGPDDKNNGQERYFYAKPFEIVMGEHFINGKLFARSYYKNNEVYKAEFASNRDGIIDDWQYFKDGKIIRIEKDTNHDGKIDEVKVRGKDF